jgi:hypothetical protein
MMFITSTFGISFRGVDGVNIGCSCREVQVPRLPPDLSLVGRQISRFLAKPLPLDGCPMFADFRVHGLNRPFFQCFHPRSTPTYRKMKWKGSAHLVNPCTRKSANMGHPSGERGWVESRESGGRNDSQPRDTFDSPSDGQLGMTKWGFALPCNVIDDGSVEPSGSSHPAAAPSLV